MSSVIFYSTRPYDRQSFNRANQNFKHRIQFHEAGLTLQTVPLIKDETALCAFVNDTLDAEVLAALAKAGIKIIALRCAGYNNIDLQAAQRLGITVTHVPAYSPNAVAEHTLCMMLALNRKIHRAYTRVREGNFSLDGLLGFDFAGRTLGIIGTGRIGSIVARIMLAMGMKVIAVDPAPNDQCRAAGVEYVELTELLTRSDVISLHCPLSEDNKHLINMERIAQMKNGVMLINTSRGAILDSKAIIQGLKSKKIGYLGLDVYEHEANLFFEDHSGDIIQDDIFERLLSFPNVLITAHQGFFTAEALNNIAHTTLQSLSDFDRGEVPTNTIRPASN